MQQQLVAKFRLVSRVDVQPREREKSMRWGGEVEKCNVCGDFVLRNWCYLHIVVDVFIYRIWNEQSVFGDIGVGAGCRAECLVMRVRTKARTHYPVKNTVLLFSFFVSLIFCIFFLRQRDDENAQKWKSRLG